MTIIVDSKTVTSCICPECDKEVEIDSQFAYYTELEGVYLKADLQEVKCSHCMNDFYASEYGLKNIPHEFLVNPPDPNSFENKLVKFHEYQDMMQDGKIIGAFTPTIEYTCSDDNGKTVKIEFGIETYLFPKKLVYLSEEQ